MASHEINAKWEKKMSFSTEVSGHKLILDADESVGGEDNGPRPKPFMLVALAGCTGMDVISILKKMQIEPSYFNVKVSGELTEEFPKYYHTMHIVYEFKGDNLPLDKLQKAVDLSQEKYCGVSALYKKAIHITSEIKVLV